MRRRNEIVASGVATDPRSNGCTHGGRAGRAAVAGFALALMGMASGCDRHLAVNAGAVPEAVPRSTQWHHHLLWGIVDLSDAEVLNAICPQGVAQVYTRMTVLNWLLAAITGGVYSPTRVDVWCAQGSTVGSATAGGHVSILLRPTPENVERWRRAFPELDAHLRAASATAAAKSAPRR